ncbi:MAG: peptidoglycan DD-metalloendopeptidase family protein [Synechococcales cyanobacterium T60_A2020_003]|nr:peptidoglycan DD-metalloendopeptidase family protein [Synechococcales cyanobacterium T60_A2020_003]
MTQLPRSFQIAATSSRIDFSEDFVEHVVESGQTLWQISQQYKVPVEVIAIANDLSENEPIQVGQRLRIPGASFTASTVAPSKTELSTSSTLVASAVPTVSPESLQDASEADRILQAEQQVALENLAQRRQQLSESLVTLNSSVSENPASNARKLEQRSSQERQQSIIATPSPEPTPLVQQPVVPEASTTVALSESSTEVTPEFADEPSQSVAVLPNVQNAANSEVAPNSVAINPAALESNEVESVTSIIYRVAPGDTISSLARKYNVPVSQLVADNNISDPNYIFVGQTLRVPVPVTAESEVSVVPPTLVAQRLDSNLNLDPAPSFNAQDQQSGSLNVSAAESSTPQQVSVVPPSLRNDRSVGEADPIPPISENPYVENLLREIRVMSERYSNAALAESAATTVAVPAEALSPSSDASDEQLQISLAVPVTQVPEAVSVPSLLSTPPTAVEPQVSARVSTVTQSSAPISSPVRSAGSVENIRESQLVAVAPLGSENYQPLLEPITGRMVSPDLPPLPSADEFLPNSQADFNGYIWPAQGQLTSGYGWRWGRMHNGIDIAAPIGTPVYAAAPGVVEYAGWNSGGYGNMIEVRHPDGSMTRYAHLDSIGVKAGQEVDQGEQIGEMGSTGYSTGPHLHFEVHLAQGTVNPIAYLP